MLGSVAAVAWATRTSGDPSRRVLGAVCLGAVVSVLVLDTTSEYLTFTAVSQEFWMLVGLLAGTTLASQASAPVPAHEEPQHVPRAVGAPAPAFGVVAPALQVSRPAARAVAAPARGDFLPRAAAGARKVGIQPGPPPITPPASPGKVVAALNGLRRERPLVSSSFAVLVGFGFARALGFLFQVTAGRALSPDGYGQLTYALAVANVAAVLITTAPLGLSRFLSRSGGDRQ